MRYDLEGLTFVKNRVGHPKRVAEEISFVARVPLKEGLRRLIDQRLQPIELVEHRWKLGYVGKSLSVVDSVGFRGTKLDGTSFQQRNGTHTEPQSGVGVITLVKSLVHHRRLVAELARRELSDQHIGQIGGAIWLYAHPLLLFAIYASLFTVVFRVRIGNQGPADYVVYLLSGLSPWLLTQDVLSRSTSVMTSNSVIVKKVMFPIESLVAKAVVASLLVQTVLIIVAAVYTAWIRGTIPASFLLMPPLFLLHVILLWGAALLLSAFTPYLRDTQELLRVFLTINIYLMPVMYIPSMVPERFRPLLALNPFSHLIWCYQDVLYYNRIVHPISWLITIALAASFIVAGSYVFTRLRHHIPSVL